MTTSTLTKRALRRPSEFPVGERAPFMLLDCGCGRTLTVKTDDYLGTPRAVRVSCDCGFVYDARGYIIERPA